MRVALAAAQMLCYGGNSRFKLTEEAVKEYKAAHRKEERSFYKQYNETVRQACKALAFIRDDGSGNAGNGSGGGGGPAVPLHRKTGRVRRKSGKFLLVLDVNGLLVDRVNPGGSDYLQSCGAMPDVHVHGSKVYKRPGVDEFVYWLTRNYEVAVWSSCRRRNLDPIIQAIFPGRLQDQLVAILDQSACDVDGTVASSNGGTKERFIKDLNRVWAVVGEGASIDHATTLMIDDSPYKAVRNPANTAIHPREYKAEDLEDRELTPGGALRTYLERLVGADTVPGFLAQTPLKQPLPQRKQQQQQQLTPFFQQQQQQQQPARHADHADGMYGGQLRENGKKKKPSKKKQKRKRDVSTAASETRAGGCGTDEERSYAAKRGTEMQATNLSGRELNHAEKRVADAIATIATAQPAQTKLAKGKKKLKKKKQQKKQQKKKKEMRKD